MMVPRVSNTIQNLLFEDSCENRARDKIELGGL